MEAVTIQKVRKGFAIDEDYKFDDCSEKSKYFEMVDTKKRWKKASKNEIVFVIDKYIIDDVAFLERKTIGSMVKFISILKISNLGKDTLKKGR